MANYGATGGADGTRVGPNFTGWSPTLGKEASTSPVVVAGSANGRVMFNGLTQDDNRIANIFQSKSNQAIRQLLISMIGAAPGALASKSFKRVQANRATDIGSGSQNIGGLVPIETIFYINRTNTVADDNNLSALFNRLHSPGVYPDDLSGNGFDSTASKSGTVTANPARNNGYF